MRMNFYICLEIPKVFSFFNIFKLHLLWGKGIIIRLFNSPHALWEQKNSNLLEEGLFNRVTVFIFFNAFMSGNEQILSPRCFPPLLSSGVYPTFVRYLF